MCKLSTWDIKVHFANGKIEITVCNVVPLHKHKRACAPLVSPGAWLLQELLQILLFFIILIACFGTHNG